MSKKKRVQVSVMVDDDHRQKLEQVANHLKVKGFKLAESLEAIGVLTGSVPAEALAKLSDVRGVSAVEENRTDYHPQT